MRRILCWFSNGAASAVACKKAIQVFGDTDDVIPVCCDTRPSEHVDNYRFSKECEKWFNREIIFLRNEDFETVQDVFIVKRYMSGIAGAVCTTQLKKLPRLKFSQSGDIHVFGYTIEEKKRIVNFRKNNPDMRFLFILAALGISKQNCYEYLNSADIELPMMYRIFDDEDRARYRQSGFDNNNCPGCVKSGSAWYWSMIRKYFPETFLERAKVSRGIGCRLVKIKGKRIFLDQLPNKIFNKGRKENLSCGPECASGIEIPKIKKKGFGL